MAPTGEEITEALKVLQLQSPNMGRKKLLAQLNADKGWSLTNKDLKEHTPEGPARISDVNDDDKGTSEPRLKGKARKAEKEGHKVASKKEMDTDLGAEAPKHNGTPESEPGSSHGGLPNAESSRQKQNCFLIRANPYSTTPALEDIISQVEPFNLESFGNEMNEMRELKARLGWNNVREVGKFYDHEGTNSWYYYVYGEEGSSQPKNEAASLVCYKKIKGDIAVIRSGPAGTDTPEYFTQRELSSAVEYYKTHDQAKVFMEREKSRMASSMGMNLSDLEGVPNLYVNHTSQGFMYSRMP